VGDRRDPAPQRGDDAPPEGAAGSATGEPAQAERVWQANSKLLYPGIAFLAAAIVGGGLKFSGVEVPLIRSPVQQALLAILGGLMILASFRVRDVPEGGIETRDGHKLLGRLGMWASTLIVTISLLVAVVGTVIVEVNLPRPQPPPPPVCAGQISLGQTVDCSVDSRPRSAPTPLPEQRGSRCA
jgi:hypothetical protein